MTSGRCLANTARAAGLSSNSPMVEPSTEKVLPAGAEAGALGPGRAKAGRLAGSRARAIKADFFMGIPHGFSQRDTTVAGRPVLSAFRLQPRHMPHLAAQARFALAIKMQGAATRQAFPGIGLGADDVLHHRGGMAGRIAERPAGHGADMLFELGAGAGLKRPVA